MLTHPFLFCASAMIVIAPRQGTLLVPFLFVGGMHMKKSCPYCGLIVDPKKHRCPNKPKDRHRRKRDGVFKEGTASISWMVHHSHRWTELSKDIRRRDGNVCQACINGLRGNAYVCTEQLEVHHIIPIKLRPDLAYDPYNLITLSHAMHELAECGLLDAKELKQIAKYNQEHRHK